MDEIESVNTNPLDLFAAECNDLEIEVRIRSIKKLSMVAVALDVERTRTELMPYLDNLTEGIYNDDEILMNLADQLANFLPFVGGVEYVDLILNILEKLTAVEENIVREKAIESLEKIAEQLDATNLEAKLVPLVFRLTDSDWFTAKCSGAALITVCYPRVPEDMKSEMRKVYQILCQDDSPLVRRTSGAKLANFIRVLELHYIKDDFIPVGENFAKDDQDSVRLLAVDITVAIALRLTPNEIEELILTTLTELCGDPSWRVRYQAANQITAIQTALGHELTRKYLILIYQNLINDTEPQVREASAKSIVRFCEILQKTFAENTTGVGDKIDPVILNQIFPLIQLLDQDSNPEVKEALSRVITTICPLLGHENTKSLLLPLITASLLNDSSKVKENIISNLNHIISVIGIADIADTVLQIIADLVNSSASVWRTRRNLIVTINYIAKHSGKEYFDAHLKSLYQKLMNDGVYAVRKTAPLILPILIKNFGFKWANKSILNDILLFAEHKHYLYRFVCLFCIDELVSPTLEAKFESATTERNRLKYLQVCNTENGSDSIITTFLNRIAELNQNIQKKLEDDWVRDNLNNLESYHIPDDDIKKYTEDTIDMFIKDNNLNIRCVTHKEIRADDVYLEGVLDLLVNKFMDVLQQLAKDPVDNVHSLVGKTLMRIQEFSNALDSELKNERVKACINTDDGAECASETEKKDVQPECKDLLTPDREVDKSSMEEEILEILEQKIKSEN